MAFKHCYVLKQADKDKTAKPLMKIVHIESNDAA